MLSVRYVPKTDIDGISASAAMHPVVDTMSFADTVTWYLLYLRFSIGPMPRKMPLIMQSTSSMALTKPNKINRLNNSLTPTQSSQAASRKCRTPHG